MRSSFKKAALTKQVALGVLIASTFSLNLAANSEPFSGKVLARKQILIAQGDASLPPPDPNYRPKNRVQADIGTGADSSQDSPIRRRMRRRLNGGVGTEAGQQGGGQQGGGQQGIGQQFGGPQVGGPAASNLGGSLGGGENKKNAFGGGFGGGGGANVFGRKALDLTSLNLTPEQKQKIQDMRGLVGPKTRELRKQLNAKRMELRDMMFEASAGDDQVRAKRKEVRQLQDKMEDLQINDFLGIRAVLSPDQRQKLTDLKPGNKVAAGNGAQLVAPVVTSP